MGFPGRGPVEANQLSCCIPASSQPEEPVTGFRTCQISSNGSASAFASSRIEPENRTLAQCSPPSVTSSRSAAFKVTTSVCCAPECATTSPFSVLNMSSVVTWRSRARSPRSFASCRRRKLRRASLTKPSTSKPAGMLETNWLRQFVCTPASPGSCEGGGAATVSLPKPAYCGRDARCFERRRVNANTIAPASKAMRSVLATAPNPPCANNQPKPRPAASPASGASQRPGPDGCGAVAGCCCVGGVACFGVAVTWRWAPMLRPPPSLAASTSSARMLAPKTSVNKETVNFFMVSLRDSEFITPMQGHDTRTQVEIFDLLEPRPFQHALQALLVGVHAYRFGEITVGSFVARHHPAQPGKHLERVPVVRLRERRPHARELEHEQPPTGPQHTAHFGEGCVFSRHVAQTEGDADTVEVVRRKRQLFCVALHRWDQAAAVEQAIAPPLQHRTVDVAEPHLSACPGTLREIERQITRPGGHIEHPLAFTHAGERHRESLP